MYDNAKINPTEISVRTDNHYRHAYPMTREGQDLCRLAGKKTITEDMIRSLFKMGYKVVDKTPRVEFNYTTGQKIKQ